MISDLDRYKAQTLQIAGFGLMTPIGQFILILLSLEPIKFNLQFVLSFIISFVFLICGIIVVAQGHEHLKL